jgi:hypothetical protein
MLFGYVRAPWTNYLNEKDLRSKLVGVLHENDLLCFTVILFIVGHKNEVLKSLTPCHNSPPTINLVPPYDESSVVEDVGFSTSSRMFWRGERAETGFLFFSFSRGMQVQDFQPPATVICSQISTKVEQRWAQLKWLYHKEDNNLSIFCVF